MWAPTEPKVDKNSSKKIRKTSDHLKKIQVNKTLIKFQGEIIIFQHISVGVPKLF
jgi:hypothetical protein